MNYQKWKEEEAGENSYKDNKLTYESNKGTAKKYSRRLNRKRQKEKD